MKGSAKLIASLNARLAEEFGAQHQYGAHEAYARTKGYVAYADYVGKRRSAEKEHSDELMERIVFLGGTPIADSLKGANTFLGDLGKSLVLDDKSEQSAIEGYRETAKLAFEEGDMGTFQLVSHILSEEEEHKRGTEANLTQFEQMGEDNWLSLQVG